MYDDPEALKSFVKDIVAVMATPNYPGTFSAEEATAIAEGIVNLEVDLKKTMPPPVMGSAVSAQQRNWLPSPLFLLTDILRTRGILL